MKSTPSLVAVLALLTWVLACESGAPAFVPDLAVQLAIDQGMAWQQNESADRAEELRDEREQSTGFAMESSADSTLLVLKRIKRTQVIDEHCLCLATSHNNHGVYRLGACAGRCNKSWQTLRSTCVRIQV